MGMGQNSQGHLSLLNCAPFPPETHEPTVPITFSAAKATPAPAVLEEVGAQGQGAGGSGHPARGWMTLWETQVPNGVRRQAPS